MPTYDYECTQCGEVVEIFHSITEAPRRRLRKDDPKPCDCNSSVRRRIGTGGGIIFKGSGFYETDYRSESYKKAAKADSEAKDAKSSSSEKSGDTEKSSDTKKTASESKDTPKKK